MDDEPPHQGGRHQAFSVARLDVPQSHSQCVAEMRQELGDFHFAPAAFVLGRETVEP